MKKTKIIALLLASVSLFANATQVPQFAKAQNNNLLCDLFGIGCPIVIQDTGGAGAEPPADE